MRVLRSVTLQPIGLALAQLEGRDRLARLRDDRLLAGDQREIGRGDVDLLAVVDALADAHVEHDLVDAPAPACGSCSRTARSASCGSTSSNCLCRRAGPFGSRLARRPSSPSAAFALAASRLRPSRPCSALRLRRLVGLAGALSAFCGLLVVLVSHRSQLPNAWRSAPSSAVAHDLEADAGRLAVLRIGERDVRQVDRRFLGDDAAFLRRASASGGA